MKFIFFKTSRHRVFNHVPIYYDEEKEAREERARELRLERGEYVPEENTSPEQRIRGKMNKRIKGNFDVVRKEKQKSTLRLILIIIILLVLAYYLFASSAEWLLKL